jgi:hypothetical protein
MVPVSVEEQQFLSVEDIIAARDIEYMVVNIPSWGGKVRLASVTADDIIRWGEANEGEAKRSMGLRLIVKSVVDKDGKHLMDESHIGMLRAKQHKATEELVKAILKLNGMDVKAEADAKND